jgi:predicted DNA-binding transcriptional regulator AlpA
MTVRYLTERDASTMLGLSRRSLQRLRVSGGGPSFVRLSPRRIAYDAQSVTAWATERTFASTAAEMASRR